MPGRGLDSLRALNYGSRFGDYNRDANYGPTGKPLGPRDVALSPNQMRKYPIGSYINAATKQGSGLGTYRVADPSYIRPGQPTRNTIEFRNRNLSGQGVNISSASNPYGFVQGGIDIFSDYPSPPPIQRPTVPTHAQGLIPGGIDIRGNSPSFDPVGNGGAGEFSGGAIPPPLGSGLTPFDPMGYGDSNNPIQSGFNIPPNEDIGPGLSTSLQYSGTGNIPPNEDVSPNITNTFLGGTDYNSTTPGTGRRYPKPGLGGTPSMNWNTNAVNNPLYPVPGVGGFPSTYGGGQSWQSNASRSGLGLFPNFFSGIARAAGFGRGLISAGAGGWQGVSEFPSFSGFGAPVGRSSAGPLQP